MKQIIGTPDIISKELQKLDKEKRYVLKDYIDTRTLQQNRYLHLVFTTIGIEWGEDPASVKAYLKSLFLKDFILVKGIEICVIKQTSKLNKKEFGKFVDDIKLWAFNNLNMHIPNPDDLRLESFYAEYGLN